MHVLLANQGHATLFKNKGNELLLKRKFENENLMKKDSQIFSDKSGAGESSFTSNQTTLGESHYKEELVSKFSSEIIHYLTKLHSSGDLDSLTLICGPKFLGEFRKKITPSLKSLITSELSKNFYTEEPYKLKLFLGTHNIALVD